MRLMLRAAPSPRARSLGRLSYEYYGTNYAEHLYGFPCGASLWAKDLVFGLNGDWWIGGDGGVCRYSSLYPPTGFAGNLFVPTIGTNVKKLSVDGDGRIWAAVMPDAAGNSGGLTAYEVLGPANTLGTVRTQDWNWLTAPIGTLTSLANGYDSGIRTITANGERVWMALNTDPINGPLAMYLAALAATDCLERRLTVGCAARLPGARTSLPGDQQRPIGDVAARRDHVGRSGVGGREGRDGRSKRPHLDRRERWRAALDADRLGHDRRARSVHRRPARSMRSRKIAKAACGSAAKTASRCSIENAGSRRSRRRRDRSP